MKNKIFAVIIVIFLLFAAGMVLQPAVTQESDTFVDIINTEQEIIPESDDEDQLAEEIFSEDFFDEELPADEMSLEDLLAQEFIEEMEEFEIVPPYRGYIYARDVPEWVQPIRWFRSNAGGLAVEEVSSRFAALRNEYAMAVDYAEREELPNELLSFYNDDKDFVEVRMLYNKGIQIKTQWIFRDFSGKARLVAVFSEQEEQTGFIEVYNEDGFLSLEYNYYEDGLHTRTDFVFKNGLMMSASVHTWENENEQGEFILSYVDSFQYNRSSFLRAVERRFFNEAEASLTNEPVRFSLPGSIREAINDRFFLGARYNTIPDFFGAVSVNKDFRMVFTTDERSRIITQTLYDDKDEVLFVITNTWSGDRITSSTKEEGDIVLAVSYEYDAAGNRIKETNTKNGVTERIVRTEGQFEIEELYIDNVIVLRATWEDGRKVSETRIRSN